VFRKTPAALTVTAPVLAQLAPTASSSTLGKLLLFFLKAGSLTFGSGLVIVPFLEQGLVQQFGWLDQRQFLIAVAIGMISPGPVVITATFVGYLVAGFWGSLISTIGIFLPSFLLVLIVAPLLARHRGNANMQGFVKGAYAAAIGTILGACILLGRIAIGDSLTVLIWIASLAVLFRWKVSNPLLIGMTAVIGLIAFPILQPGWVMVHLGAPARRRRADVACDDRPIASGRGFGKTAASCRSNRSSKTWLLLPRSWRPAAASRWRKAVPSRSPPPPRPNNPACSVISYPASPKRAASR
jgi:chromate transport protein ChrA